MLVRVSSYLNHLECVNSTGNETLELAYWNCETCTATGLCKACNNGFWDDLSQSCVNNCPLGKFGEVKYGAYGRRIETKCTCK